MRIYPVPKLDLRTSASQNNLSECIQEESIDNFFDMPKVKRKPKVLEENEIVTASQAGTRINAAAEIRANSKVAAFINKGNSLDSQAQREIAVLNIHKSALKKKKPKNVGGVNVTSHKHASKINKFQSQIHQHQAGQNILHLKSKNKPPIFSQSYVFKKS